MRLTFCAVAVLLMTGCHSDDSSTPQARVPQSIERPAANVQPRREVLGASVQGRRIEIEHFGQGTPILILGGIHGDEVTSVDLTRNLIILLRARPDLCSGKAVSIIEVANPDGYAKKTRTNSRGIDCNRNFPARNFKPGGAVGYRGGAAAASEPETRAILSAIAQIRPRLIISIHSIRNGRECNNYDGPAEEIARVMSAQNGYPATPTIGYPTPGSLGSYAGNDLRIPMVTLELPREQDGKSAWENNRAALLAAIRSAH